MMLVYMDIIAVIAATLIISQFLIHNIIKMLCSTDKGICTSVNYRGKAIPAIGGIVFVPILLVAIILLLLQRSENFFSYINYLILVLSMGFAGVIDDLIGDKTTKGLVNHIKSALSGIMTTGFLKALTGFLVSCIIGFKVSNSYIEFVVNVFIISLFANTLNLFDLRPGRAVKVFLAASLMLLAAAIRRPAEAAPIIILNMVACLYIRYDLKEICMLGDTGANILGITLGYYSSLFFGLNAKLLLLALLLLLNIISERLSITTLINNSRVLSYLDSIGRGQTGNR